MSKDKGSKNHKKAPADRSADKGKVLSAYKAESKSGDYKQPTLEAFLSKPDPKARGSHKSKKD